MTEGRYIRKAVFDKVTTEKIPQRNEGLSCVISGPREQQVQRKTLS